MLPIRLPTFSAIQRQYIAAFSCQLSVMMVGTCFAWFTPLLKNLTSADSHIPMTTEESSWMIASIEIGEIISPVPAGFLVNKWGRKTTLLMSFPLTAVSWILVMCTRSFATLLVVRILQGSAMGIVFTAAPIYLAEISEPKIRGALCGNFQTFWVLGILYAFLTGPLLKYENYAIAAFSVAILFLLTFIWVPESPHYFIMKSMEDKAKMSLTYLRGTSEVDNEIKSIKSSLEGEKTHQAQWKDLYSTKENRRALIIVTAVCFVKYMSGSVAITGYVTLTIGNSLGNQVNEHFIAVAIGFVMFFASISSAYLSDILGRKPLIFISVVGAVLFNIITGTYFLLLQLEISNVKNCGWIAYLSLGAYCIVANVGFNPLLQTLQAECFPSRVRGHAGAFVSFIGTVFIFIALKQYQPVADWIGVYLNFYSFSLYALIGSLAVFKFMQETAGKSLEDIQSNNQDEIIASTKL